MAGALSKRDIEMIFRAETDKASRPIGALTDEVKQLRQALKDQIEAAERGEVSLDSLADTTKKLKQAQDELGTARSLLTSLNNQVAALERAEQKATEAAEKYDQLRKQVEAAERPTKRLVNSMEAAGRAVEATADRQAKLRAEVAATREQIESIIGPVGNFQDSFRQVAETSRDIARGLAISGEAADQFKAKLAGIAAADRDSQGLAAFQVQAADAGLLKSQIDYISQFENRIELLAQAKRELAAQDANFQRSLQAQDARIGAQNVQRISAAFEEAAAEAQRLESANAFRSIAAQASAAAADSSRFASQFDTAGAAAERLADNILKIVSPTRVANATIDGLEESIVRASAVLDGGKTSTTEYAAAYNELGAATAAAVRQARDIDAYRQQQAALEASSEKFRQAQANVQALAQALQTAEAPTEEMARELRAAEAVLETSGKEMQRNATILDDLGAKLRKTKVDVNDLAAAETRLAQAARQAAAAQKEITGRTGGQGGLFGLTPQDATNLGYQINDIFTQLASGQSIFITLAQQGPQIWQIEGVKGAIVQYARFIPILAAVAAVAGTVAAAIGRASDQASRIRENGAFLSTLGDTNGATAEGLAKVQQGLTDVGIAAKDAQKATREFVAEGLDPKYYEDFATAAKNASAVTGVDFVDASRLLTEAMKGGYDQVVALDDRFHFLTDSEKVQIQAMYDSGRASEARELVFDRFYSKMATGADNMNGPWKNAVNNFKAAFNVFLDFLGSTTVVQDFIKDVDSALVGLNYILLRARGLNAEQAGRAAVNGGRAPAAPRRAGSPGNGQRTGTTAEGQRAIADAERELDVRKRLTKEERLRNASIEARRKAQKEGYTDAEVERLAQLAAQKEQRAIDAENANKAKRAGRSADATRRRLENEAKALQNRIDNQAESLATSLDRMSSQIARQAIGTIEEQIAAAGKAVDDQYAKLYRQLEDFARLAGPNARINGQSQAGYRAQLDANKEILTQQRQAAVYEKAVNDLLAQRKRELDDIAGQLQDQTISPAAGVEKTLEVTSRLNPLIEKAATDAQRFIATLKPGPDMDALAAKMRDIAGSVSQAATAAQEEDLARSAYESAQRRLQQIVQNRNANVAAIQALVDMNVISQEEAEARIRAAFEASTPLINQQVAALRAALEALRGVIDPNLYAQWSAELDGIVKQTEYIPQNVMAINMAARQAFSQGFTQMFDALAQGIAGVITGTKSAGDALAGLGKAALGFAASFIKAMADVIVQILAVQAVKSIFGASLGGGIGSFFGFHIGGTVGSYAHGRQRLSRSPSLQDFANIQTYHSGTQGVGLKKDEQMAILQKGEKVLTEEQQRREETAKTSSGGGAVGLRQVLAFGDDQIAAAMAGTAGERTTVTHIRRNLPMIKQMLRD